MKIFGKLMSAFALSASVAALVGIIAWVGLYRVGSATDEMADLRVPATEALFGIMETQYAIQSGERTLLIPSLSLESRKKQMEEFSILWPKAGEFFSRYDALEKSPAEAELWSRFMLSWGEWKTEHQKLIGVVALVRDDNIEILEGTLQARRLDHVRWVAALDRSVREGRPFTGQLDPTRCALGSWLGEFKAHNPDLVEALEGFDGPHKRLHQLGGEINDLLRKGAPGQARRLFEREVLPTLKEIEGSFDLALLIVQSDIELMRAAAEIAFGSGQKALKLSEGLIDELTGVNRTLTEASRAQASSTAFWSNLLNGLAILGGVALALMLGYRLARKLALPMGRVVEMLQEMEKGHLEGRLALDGEDEIAQMASAMDGFAENLQQEVVGTLGALSRGDLTCDIQPRDKDDEFRWALKKVIEDLRTLLGQIRGISDNLTSGSGHLADSSQALAQGATEQASSLEEISASMTEMAARIRQSADHAGSAREISGRARQAADRGTDRLREMIDAMKEIDASGRSISKIIKTIDEIAFQTNLLALNAAVEAARAGKHGKGFAVVAEEVRNLAARCTQAARETAGIIETSVAKAENGTVIADRAGSALKEITEGVAQVTGLVEEIASAAQEQAQGVEQITAGLAQIEKVTQQSTASAEETASASEQLTGLVKQLRHMLGRFTLEKPSERPALPAEPETRAATAGWGWGGLAPAAAPDSLAAMEKSLGSSTPVIALDDSDFGKY